MAPLGISEAPRGAVSHRLTDTVLNEKQTIKSTFFMILELNLTEISSKMDLINSSGFFEKRVGQRDKCTCYFNYVLWFKKIEADHIF